MGSRYSTRELRSRRETRETAGIALNHCDEATDALARKVLRAAACIDASGSPASRRRKAVYRPKFIVATLEGQDMAAITSAFFRGVFSHEYGARIWKECADQSW